MPQQRKLNYPAIIFDRDGTLFDSLDVIFRAFDHAAQPYRKKLPSREEWVAAFGPAEKEVLAKFIPPDEKEAAFERFFEYYKQNFGQIHLYPGMKDLVFELKERGAKLMLFTGGGRVSTRYCLEQTGIRHLFDALVCGEDVRWPKPHPEGILKLIQDQMLEPAQAIVVGDASSDVEAGHAAGIHTAWLCWSENAKLSRPSVAPDFVCRSIKELESVLFS